MLILQVESQESKEENAMGRHKEKQERVGITYDNKQDHEQTPNHFPKHKCVA